MCVVARHQFLVVLGGEELSEVSLGLLYLIFSLSLGLCLSVSLGLVVNLSGILGAGFNLGSTSGLSRRRGRSIVGARHATVHQLA